MVILPMYKMEIMRVRTESKRKDRRILQYSRQQMIMARIKVIIIERKMCKYLEYILKKVPIKLTNGFKVQR